MKKLRYYSKKGVLALVIIMFLTVPNLTVYSAVGNYDTSSDAVIASTTNRASEGARDRTLGLGQQSGAAYAVGMAVGALAHAVYDYFGGHPELEGPIYGDSSYSSDDFTKFDN